MALCVHGMGRCLGGGVGRCSSSVGELGRAYEIVRDESYRRVLGLSLRRQRPYNDFPGLQALNPV